VRPARRASHSRPATPRALGARWRTVLGSLDLDGDRVEVRLGEEDAIAAFHVSGLEAGEIHAAGATFRCIAGSDDGR
jgi:hypothetical protein